MDIVMTGHHTIPRPADLMEVIAFQRGFDGGDCLKDNQSSRHVVPLHIQYYIFYFIKITIFIPFRFLILFSIEVGKAY